MPIATRSASCFLGVRPERSQYDAAVPENHYPRAGHRVSMATRSRRVCTVAHIGSPGLHQAKAPRPKINLAAPTLCPVFRSILELLSKGWSQPLCPRQVGVCDSWRPPGIASLAMSIPSGSRTRGSYALLTRARCRALAEIQARSYRGVAHLGPIPISKEVTPCLVTPQ
jgi:hypothetical protein